MPSGHCNTAEEADEGKVRSKTPTQQLHGNCPGSTHTPYGWLFCDCPCHEWDLPGVTAGAVKSVKEPRKTPTGKRTRSEVNDLGVTLAAKRTVSIPAPDNPKAVASARASLYNAAKKQGLQVKVSVKDGRVTATVKG